MEIILKEDIIGLGFKNEIVNVKSGYGRNYLIPQGQGVIASPSAKKILAENLKQQAHKLAAQKAAAEEKAAVLEGVALEIAAKVSATGQLYGSVGAAQVAEELAKLNELVSHLSGTNRTIKLTCSAHLSSDLESYTIEHGSLLLSSSLLGSQLVSLLLQVLSENLLG